MDLRRACAALVAAAVVLSVAGCGGGRSSFERCVSSLREVESVETTFGDQLFVLFADGSRIGVVFARSADEAARLAPGAGGPGDPYAYEAVGNAIVAWPGSPGDPHLRAVERCLR